MPKAGSLLNASSVTVYWSGDDPVSGISHYIVRIDNGMWIDVGTSTNYTFPSLSDGTHTVTVIAYDKAGNMSMATVSFTVLAEKHAFLHFLFLLLILTQNNKLLGLTLFFCVIGLTALFIIASLKNPLVYKIKQGKRGIFKQMTLQV
ncbi:MAG: Ig-like domain-containing protein [Candidatus Jordarchaeales archaeon]